MTGSGAGLLRHRDAATTFIGRRDELARLAAAFRAGSRLITLVGPAGVGKTRLALRAARNHGAENAGAADIADEAVLVDLSALRPGEPPDAVLAETIAPAWRGRGAAVDAAAESLRDHRTLVLLDGCDTAPAEAAHVADVLVRRCPQVRVLATAREPLWADAETVWPVAPLAVPAADRGPATAEPPPGRDHGTGGQSSHAAQLFIDRARLARRDMTFSARTLGDVDRIVRTVEGLPLAIELAASRVRMLSVREIADTLDLGMLADGRRGGDLRQHSMRASLDWSYRRLSVPERILFRRLAVFRGWWTEAAAVAVCADEHLPPDAVARHLDALVDKSLVTRRPTAARFRMLRPIRDYAGEAPDATDPPAVRAAVDREAVAVRHVRHHLDVAERTNAAGRPLAADSLDGLRDAAPDFRAALAHASGRRPEDALRLAAALGPHWRLSGRPAEGADALARALADAPEAPAPARAAALADRSALLLWLGDHTRARTAAVEAVRVATRAADPTAYARARTALAGLGVVNGTGDARPVIREAVDRARASGDPVALGDALALLTLCLLWQSDSPAMAEAADACLAVARPHGHAYAEAVAQWCRAHDARTRLDLPRARELAATLLRPAGDDGLPGAAADGAVDAVFRSGAVQILALVDVHEGRPRRAKARIRQELARIADTAVPWSLSLLLQARAHAELAAGEHAAARATALLLYDRTRDRCAALAWRALDVLTQVALADRDIGTARAHAGEITAIGTRTADPAARAAGQLGLAQADVLAGDLGSAEILARNAAETGCAAELPQEAADALDTLAHVAAIRGRLTRAAYLTAAAEALAPTRLGVRAAASRSAVRDAVAGLDAPARAAAFAEGARATLDSAAEHIRRTRGRTRADRGRASLTAAEAEVARLAADGLRNPAIAEQLVVARGTVKVHLSRVYAKLGVANRTELAVYLRDARSAPDGRPGCPPRPARDRSSARGG